MFICLICDKNKMAAQIQVDSSCRENVANRTSRLLFLKKFQKLFIQTLRII